MDVLAGVFIAVVLLFLAAGLLFDRQPQVKVAEKATTEEGSYERELRNALTAEDRAWLSAMGWKDPTPRSFTADVCKALLAKPTDSSRSVVMHHPQLGNARTRVALAAVDDLAAKGWLLMGQHTPEPFNRQ